ncbi:hypothetical protein [Eshraghiella crossota]|uniref:hypothetical protein n=1 Tax=Eshraghiella crossota TaxID=45851 RepID=UPI003F7CFDD9
MRIIDADKFKKQIAGMAIVNGYSAQKVNKMCELIDEQPTAYDVDAVVEQLKEWTFNADVNIGDGTMMNHNLIVSKNAIEIVKAGGIDVD